MRAQAKYIKTAQSIYDRVARNHSTARSIANGATVSDRVVILPTMNQLAIIRKFSGYHVDDFLVGGRQHGGVTRKPAVAK